MLRHELGAVDHMLVARLGVGGHVVGPNLAALAVSCLSGDEAFIESGQPADFSVSDFWKWGASDLISNATRGLLAEYLVARALDVPTNVPRREWDAVDLRTTEGWRIEVKSAAYVQTWMQKKLSAISFGVRETRGWNAETGESETLKRRMADLYVFALFRHDP